MSGIDDGTIIGDDFHWEVGVPDVDDVAFFHGWIALFEKLFNFDCYYEKLIVGFIKFKVFIVAFGSDGKLQK